MKSSKYCNMISER